MPFPGGPVRRLEEILQCSLESFSSILSSLRALLVGNAQVSLKLFEVSTELIELRLNPVVESIQLGLIPLTGSRLTHTLRHRIA